MLPRTNPTVLTIRDAVAQLLNDAKGTKDTGDTGDIGDALAWPVRLALSSAFNYLDDGLPTLTPPPSLDQRCERADVATRIQAMRDDLLRLIDDLPADVDPYAVGHAAAELRTALRELTTGRPA